MCEGKQANRILAGRPLGGNISPAAAFVPVEGMGHVLVIGFDKLGALIKSFASFHHRPQRDYRLPWIFVGQQPIEHGDYVFVVG